jgi:hypothetical protein
MARRTTKRERERVAQREVKRVQKEQRMRRGNEEEEPVVRAVVSGPKKQSYCETREDLDRFIREKLLSSRFYDKNGLGVEKERFDYLRFNTPYGIRLESEEGAFAYHFGFELVGNGEDSIKIGVRYVRTGKDNRNVYDEEIRDFNPKKLRPKRLLEMARLV